MDRPLPESPEAVALELLRMIEKNKPADPDPKVSERDRILGLYSQCLAVVLSGFGQAGGESPADRVLH